MRFFSEVSAPWWYLTPHEIWYLFLFVMVFIILVFLLDNRVKLMKKFNTESEEVQSLQNKITTLEDYIKELEQKMKSMQLLINLLLERGVVAPEVIVNKPEATEAKTIHRPVLLVYGDEKFGDQDRNAMRRAGVTFFRLRSATLESLRTELHRRRSDGNLYDMVHISSHGSAEGIQFEQSIVDGQDLSEVFSGVRGIFLATCSNQLIADKLVGIVKYVIVVYEEIETTMATDFVFEFYKRYKINQDIEASFVGAVTVMPQIGEFVDLRIGGK